jgi:hypothetical protein
VSDRDLEREAQKMEESFSEAANVGFSIDTREIQRKLEQAIPGGSILGTAVDAVATGGGGGGRGSSDAVGAASGVAGEGATLGLLEQQTDLLEDIRTELRGESRGGGGGSGAAAFALGSATSGTAALSGGLLALLGGTSLLTAGAAGGAAGFGAGQKLFGGTDISKELWRPITEGEPPDLGKIFDGDLSSTLNTEELGLGENPLGGSELPAPFGEGKSLVDSALSQIPGQGNGQQSGGGLFAAPPWVNKLLNFEIPRPEFVSTLTSFEWPNPPSLSNQSWPDPPKLSELSWPAAPEWMQPFLRAVGEDSGDSGKDKEPDVTYTPSLGESTTAQHLDDRFRLGTVTDYEATRGEQNVGSAYDSRYRGDPAADPSEVERERKKKRPQLNIDVQFEPNLNLQGQNLRQALEEALRSETGNLEQQILDDLRNELRSGF